MLHDGLAKFKTQSSEHDALGLREGSPLRSTPELNEAHRARPDVAACKKHSRYTRKRKKSISNTISYPKLTGALR